MPTLAEITVEMLRLFRSLEKAIDGLYEKGHVLAQTEHDYRKGKALAFARAPEGTVPEREAWVNAETSDLRLARDLAEGDRLAALEAQRSRRTQLSALQTIANGYRAEAELASTGPQEGP